MRFIFWPRQDAPVPADAIVVLAGSGHRRRLARTLADHGYAPVLVVADDDRRSDHLSLQVGAGIEVVRFVPDPSSTRGEARFVARLARERGWRRVIIVPRRTQVLRARLRFHRCWPEGEILAIAPDDPASVFEIGYELAAMVKAMTIERGC